VDLTTSGSNEADESGFHSILAISGCAGDGANVTSDAPKGTGTIVKTTFHPEGARHSVAKLRHRFQTCDASDSGAGGKPGISCCRFHGDGRMRAVGGWDHRTRLISRNGKILALLRGNSATVTSVDWCPDTTSGLLATGSGDGSIYLWQAYPS
jgi:WD40 repeat protein